MCPLTSELVRKISTALFLPSMLCAAICRTKVSMALQYACHSPKPRIPAGKQSTCSSHSTLCYRKDTETGNVFGLFSFEVLLLRKIIRLYSPSCFITLADAFTWALTGRGGNFKRQKKYNVINIHSLCQNKIYFQRYCQKENVLSGYWQVLHFLQTKSNKTTTFLLNVLQYWGQLRMADLKAATS